MKNVFNLILGFALIGLIIWTGWFCIGLIVSFILTLDKAIQASISTGLFLLVIAYVTYLANKSLESRKATEQAIRPKKLELYEGFIKFFMRILGNEEHIKKPTQDEIIKFFIEATPLITTYASNAVIKKWGKLRISLETSGTDGLFQLEELLKEIRKDLGHGKFGSSKGDILRMFVNDIDAYLTKTKAPR